MKRVLIIASVASMIDQFNMPNIKLLKDMGYSVDVACNFKEGNTCSDEKIEKLKQELKRMNVRCYQIDFDRTITKIFTNLRAFWQIEYVLEMNQYEFLHCHSPIGGVVGRIAGKLKKTKVIYTAHGFHFYKGAPKKNWVAYYPIEKICSHMTDILITINKEDYELAKKKMKAKKVVYVPGVGVDLKKFSGMIIDKMAKRKEVEIPKEAVWILAVGELTPRKNHENLIRAIAKMENTYLTVAGKGELQSYLLQLIKKLGLTERVKLLGFRTDISELCEACDIFAFPSFQEGLPVALMEAMASGKPVVCSRIRGNKDLLEEGKGGFFFEPSEVDEIVDAINRVMKSDRKAFGKFNFDKIRTYDLLKVTKLNKETYEKITRGGGRITKILNSLELKRSIGCEKNDLLFFSVGELNENKNHAIVIRALGELKREAAKDIKIHYAIAGKGILKEKLKQIARDFEIEDRIHFLGFRSDVKEWYAAADVYVFPSYREGLSVSLMEAMTSGLPCVVSRIRGNTDLVDINGGRLFNSDSLEELKCAIEEMTHFNRTKRNELGEYNKFKIRKFGLSEVTKRNKKLYEKI